MKDIEKTLRASRPEPREEFVAALSTHVHEHTRPRRGGAFRLAFATGLTVTMLVAVAAVGGVSYAAETFVGAARTLEKAVSPSSAREAIVVNRLSAGGDQYRPGFGWGDANHTHTGPPGLSRQGAAPLRARPNPADRRFTRVRTAINLDEQATLSVSVQTAGGQPLLISQQRSVVGRGVDGKATKNVRYTVLVPRNGIPIDLSIPANLLVPGRTYFIVVTATDPSGEQRVLRIPFRA